MTYLLTIVTDTDMHQKSICVSNEMLAHCRTEEWADDLSVKGEKIIYAGYDRINDWTPANHVRVA